MQPTTSAFVFCVALPGLHQNQVCLLPTSVQRFMNIEAVINLLRPETGKASWNYVQLPDFRTKM